tara:strand:+ start:2720 stop:3244 length:525 start_codon:yes stop_codon:yes gene_type:complete
VGTRHQPKGEDKMKETIKIDELEKKTAKNGGTYLLIQSDGSKYSCWDKFKQVWPELQKNIGNHVEVEVEVNGDYKNITGFWGAGEAANSNVTHQKVTNEPAAKPAAATVSNEPRFRVKIKETAKGNFYWECTVRGNDKGELQTALDDAVEIAKLKTQELNINNAIDDERKNESN